jgi:hypothetical protein
MNFLYIFAINFLYIITVTFIIVYIIYKDKKEISLLREKITVLEKHIKIYENTIDNLKKYKSMINDLKKCAEFWRSLSLDISSDYLNLTRDYDILNKNKF